MLFFPQNQAWIPLQGSNLEEQSDSYERYSSENAAESLEQEFDPQLDDDEEDSQETLGALVNSSLLPLYSHCVLQVQLPTSCKYICSYQIATAPSWTQPQNVQQTQ